ncbi:hypothetical protein NDU88_002710 [Pleurodeles waltl]|uniref:Uncharacterized protein n=1 Tax=Pleurodeles waltl TaxID=8319 RepID=A0AAV7UC00_PLEWA|nr:hypothetical protein NDU88_002710 [Pleurodeles waltl]
MQGTVPGRSRALVPYPGRAGERAWSADARADLRPSLLREAGALGEARAQRRADECDLGPEAVLGACLPARGAEAKRPRKEVGPGLGGAQPLIRRREPEAPEEKYVKPPLEPTGPRTSEGDVRSGAERLGNPWGPPIKHHPGGGGGKKEKKT